MNSMTKIIVQLFPGRSNHQRNAATTAGIALLLMAAAIPASAQFFPTEEPVVVFTDDFSTFTEPTYSSPDTGICTAAPTTTATGSPTATSSAAPPATPGCSTPVKTTAVPIGPR
jgi:hypothetical protein